jgi:hypothetical protein
MWGSIEALALLPENLSKKIPPLCFEAVGALCVPTALCRLYI